MATAKQLKDLYSDKREKSLETYKKDIEQLLKEEANQKKAADILSELIKQK